jgi:hypothetical protein
MAGYHLIPPNYLTDKIFIEQVPRNFLSVISCMHSVYEGKRSRALLGNRRFEDAR